MENVQPRIRYVSLGDSYTVGEGVDREETWPTLLTKHLQKEGIAIDLIANLAKTGWLTEHIIKLQIPIFEKYQPTLASLLTGANDWIQEVPIEMFQRNIQTIINRVQRVLPDKKKILLMTIPDFSVTQVGQIFATGRDIVKGIGEFNEIIKKEGFNRDLAVIDMFPISQGMRDNPELVALDGLHPSAKEYELWEKEIFPAALKLLKET